MKRIANFVGAVQGDVPIRKIESIPSGAKKTKRCIVAYGEATGHHHTLVGECELYETQVEMFPGIVFVVPKNSQVELTHPEHDTIVFAEGVWFVPDPGYQQVEYDGENERRVLD